MKYEQAEHPQLNSLTDSPWASDTSTESDRANFGRTSALNRQVSGDHYKTMPLQPVEFIVANNIPFLEGNAIKYLCRHLKKGGVEDLRKAKHYIDLILEKVYEVQS